MSWDGIEQRESSKKIEEILMISAQVAHKVADTAQQAISGITTAMNVTNLDIRYIKDDISEIKLMLDKKYVTVDQFDPVRKLVYGQIALILIGVVSAVLSLVLRR